MVSPVRAFRERPPTLSLPARAGDVWEESMEEVILP